MSVKLGESYLYLESAKFQKEILIRNEATEISIALFYL